MTRRACHLTFVCPNCILCHRIFIFRVYLEDTDDMALCLSQLFDSSQPGFQSYFYHLAPVKTLGFFNLRLAKLKRIYYQISKRYPEVRRSLGTACWASGPFFFFFFFFWCSWHAQFDSWASSNTCAGVLGTTLTGRYPEKERKQLFFMSLSKSCSSHLTTTKNISKDFPWCLWWEAGHKVTLKPTMLVERDCLASGDLSEERLVSWVTWREFVLET